MMRVVLDANVFISGLISKLGPPGQILDAWLDRKFTLCISPQISAEIKRVLDYPRIRNRLDSGQADQLIASLETACEWVDGNLVLDVLFKDPTDNIYLACAIEAGAVYLVTGNLTHLIEVGNPFQGTHILTPRNFLTALKWKSS
jgi:putative PIN family toxin of toxin-antitoxin system